jgi:hypothetical protein
MSEKKKPPSRGWWRLREPFYDELSISNNGECPMKVSFRVAGVLVGIVILASVGDDIRLRNEVQALTDQVVGMRFQLTAASQKRRAAEIARQREIDKSARALMQIGSGGVPKGGL